MADNSKSRKYLLTFNNPSEHGFTHEKINNIMRELKWEYYCMCDEIGENGTYHTHLFFYCKNPVQFSRVHKLFPTVHIDVAYGSANDNKNYILKEGKYSDTDKKDTNLPDTFEEYGNMPLDNSERSEKVSEAIRNMVKEGKTNAEIIDAIPSAIFHTNNMDKYRKILLKEEHKNKRIKKNVIYISGESETGKSRYVLDTHGDENVFIVSDYKHPFDNYEGEPVILFDEFHSDIEITSMLRYLDIYGCELPARYGNTYAAYNTVYIISNISLDEQYPCIDNNTFNAFIRRIDRVLDFTKIDKNAPEYFPENIVRIDIHKGQYRR